MASASDTTESGLCPHCGQPLPGARAVVEYGDKRANKAGIAVTVALHLLLVLVYLIQPHDFRRPNHMIEGMLVMLPSPHKSAPKPEAPPKPVAKAEKPHVIMPRLPNTITLPQEKPVREAEKAEPTPIPKEMDMQAYVEARRRARGEPEQAPSENERALANIRANIARANAASQGDDGTGGVFSVTNQTFASADLKFRGWNPNFKRRWLQQVTVELGKEPDIETAIIKKMIEIIRKEKTGDFEWESHRLHRTVTLSARPQDTAALTAFLFKEMFPNYIKPAAQ